MSRHRDRCRCCRARSKAERRLAARTRDRVPETLLTSEELAARIGLRTRQSVHDWRRKGRIVGWQNARRGYVFPAAQLDEQNRPLAGLDRVTGLFADSYSAWVWLTTPRRHAVGCALEQVVGEMSAAGGGLGLGAAEDRLGRETGLADPATEGRDVRQRSRKRTDAPA